MNMMRTIRSFIQPIMGGLVILTSCGKESGNSYLYLSVQEEDRVAVYRIIPGSGGLEQQRSLPVEGSPACLTLHPSGNYMYVAQRSARTISSLRVDRKTGLLERHNTIPSHNPVYLATDRSGRFLLAAFNEKQPGLENQMKAAIYRIRSDGQLEPEVVQEILTGLKPHSITTDPSNRFLYIPCTDAEYIMQFRFDAETGTCEPLVPPVQETPTGTGPRHFEFAEESMIYYINETHSTVTGYRIDPDRGILAPFQTLSTLPEGFEGNVISADIHLTPGRKFLYATNRRDHNSIAGYRVDPKTGELTMIGIWPTERMPREFDIDPSGQYLYCAGEASGNLAIYRIDGESGDLIPLSTLRVGERPTWVLSTRY
jgi:6-phosphogluconolactonase